MPGPLLHGWMGEGAQCTLFFSTASPPGHQPPDQVLEASWRICVQSALAALNASAITCSWVLQRQAPTVFHKIQRLHEQTALNFLPDVAYAWSAPFSRPCFWSIRVNSFLQVTVKGAQLLKLPKVWMLCAAFQGGTCSKASSTNMPWSVQNYCSSSRNSSHACRSQNPKNSRGWKLSNLSISKAFAHTVCVVIGKPVLHPPSSLCQLTPPVIITSFTQDISRSLWNANPPVPRNTAQLSPRDMAGSMIKLAWWDLTRGVYSTTDNLKANSLLVPAFIYSCWLEIQTQ